MMAARRQWSVAATAVVLGLAVGLGACGAGIERIDVHDERLPLDARRWVGDAEDAVTVANAWLEDAELTLSEVRAWRGQLSRAQTPMAKALVELGRARVRLAERRVGRAEADRGLALAKLDLVNAETAVRHDIELYELAPLREAVTDARAEVEATARAVEDERAVLDQVTTDLWRAYQGYASGGGDTRILWLPEAAARGSRGHRGR